MVGDGRGDLLAVHSANTPWRFDGTGNGTFQARVQVNGAGWASGRGPGGFGRRLPWGRSQW